MRSRRALRGAAVGLAALGLVVAMLWLAVPPAETEEDGRPDPILRLRRPIVRLLRHVGILEDPVFLQEDLWLPSGYESRPATREGDGPWVALGTFTYRKRPVYRGLFWRVGSRWTVEVEDDDARPIRLVVVEGAAAKTHAGERVDPEVPGKSRFRVQAFVSDVAGEWRLERVGDDGTAEPLYAWERETADRGPSPKD